VLGSRGHQQEYLLPMPIRHLRSLCCSATLGGLLVASTPAFAGPAPTSTEKPAGAANAAKGQKRSIALDMNVQQFSLANGLRVYVLEDHSTPTFAMHLVYDVGSRDEEANRTGFAHLFEHMMFKGSKNVPDGGHFKHVLGVGGEMNASTAYDYTNYYNVLPSHYLDMGLWLEADRMRSLEVTDKNFENQRSAVKEEKAMRVDNVPYTNAIQEFFAKIWKGSGYGHPPIGSLADLDAAQTKDVQAFFSKYYVPNNAVLVLVGDVTFDEVKQKVEKYMGEIPRGPDKPKLSDVVVERNAPLEVRSEDPLARTPVYLIGWRTVPEDHPDRFAIDLLGNVLLSGESSRITKILKDQKQLALGSQFLPLNMRSAGLVAAIVLPVEGASFDAIKQIVKDEVAKARKQGVTAKELQKAVNQQLMDTVATLATNRGRAFAIGFGVTQNNDPKRVLTELERFQAVTVKDIKRVANEYFTDNWVMLEIVPKK